MKSKIPVVLLSFLLAGAIGFGAVVSTRWKEAEQRAADKTDFILSYQYNLLRQVAYLPDLLDEDGVVSQTKVTRYFIAFSSAETSCSLIYPAVAEEEGWGFFTSSTMGKNTLFWMCNTVQNALSLLSFEEGGVCKPEGNLLLLVQAVDSWKDKFYSAFYSTAQNLSKYGTDIYSFYQDCLAPTLEQEIVQNEESIKLIREVEYYTQLIRAAAN